MPRRGRARKKTRTHVTDNNTEVLGQQSSSALVTTKEELKVPKSLVIRRGTTAPEVQDLVQDLRLAMQPYTALHFQEDPKNRKLTLAKYATHLALPMGITHVMSLSQTDERLHLRVARTPEGPTLTFRVHRFSLGKHIRALQKRPVSWTSSLSGNPPVVVTNNFGEASAPPHVKLMRITFQNMFPAINVSTVQLAQCRRILLFNLVEQDEKEKKGGDESQDDTDHNSRTKQPGQASGDNEGTSDGGRIRSSSSRERKKVSLVQVRHYAIKASPVGVNRRVRRIVQDKIPNLGKCYDVADYLSGKRARSGSDGGHMSDAASDSEPEDDPTHVVQLPDKYVGKGNSRNQKSALKLIELGPRLTLELIKVEKELGGGDVLYHAHVHKSPQEAADLRSRKQQEQALKEQRRAQQEANVQRKRQAADEQRQAKKQRRAEKEQVMMESLRAGQKTAVSSETNNEDDDIDDIDDKDNNDSDNDDGDDNVEGTH